MNTCGKCAHYFDGLASDDHDPMIQLTLVTGAGRVSVSRRLLQLLSPPVRVEIILEKLRLSEALAPYKHMFIGVLKMANLLSRLGRF